MKTKPSENKDQIIAKMLRAFKIALGQLEGCKPLSGVHASSLRADIEIVRSAIEAANTEPRETREIGTPIHPLNLIN